MSAGMITRKSVIEAMIAGTIVPTSARSFAKPLLSLYPCLQLRNTNILIPIWMNPAKRLRSWKVFVKFAIIKNANPMRPDTNIKARVLFLIARFNLFSLSDLLFAADLVKTRFTKGESTKINTKLITLDSRVVSLLLRENRLLRAFVVVPMFEALDIGIQASDRLSAQITSNLSRKLTRTGY